MVDGRTSLFLVAVVAAVIDSEASLGHYCDYPPGRQSLVCYENQDYSGDQLRLCEYAARLEIHKFNDGARSCCFKRGIWLLYENPNFNRQGGYTFWGYGENSCFTLSGYIDKRASSVRFAGAPNDYKLDTLNFYELSYFSGEERYFYGDQVNSAANVHASSAIVTGCHPFELFDDEGNSHCLYPLKSSDCVCCPGFYQDLAGLGIKSPISRIRRGCAHQANINGIVQK